MKTLRDRCRTFLAGLSVAPVAPGYDKSSEEVFADMYAGRLLEFVESERGRSADSSLKDTMPLVLYFADEKDREEFIALILAAKPNMIAKKMP